MHTVGKFCIFKNVIEMLICLCANHNLHIYKTLITHRVDRLGKRISKYCSRDFYL